MGFDDVPLLGIARICVDGIASPWIARHRLVSPRREAWPDIPPDEL
jgi:hypothetical protein